MIGGDEYPSTAIGINLPNAEWIRAQYGSKSVTISNFMKAYDEASKESGFLEEFVCDNDTVAMIRKYGEQCDSLHTDLHECLGHGSGQLLPGVSPEALKAYGNTIEEARADLFALYYIADPKLLSLGLVPDMEAYKASYYTYIMNGLLTQAVRIKEGADYEEAHMRNRALIAGWALRHSDGNIQINTTVIDGEEKHFLVINDYESLRRSFGILLAEIQRIKSEGDYEAARSLVETYGVKIDPTLHHEVLQRYARLNIAPYKGFLNPKMTPVFDGQGEITDVTLDFTETMEEQMMRYSTDYSVS
jgi:dipeptidyl-peptidase-3